MLNNMLNMFRELRHSSMKMDPILDQQQSSLPPLTLEDQTFNVRSIQLYLHVYRMHTASYGTFPKLEEGNEFEYEADNIHIKHYPDGAPVDCGISVFAISAFPHLYAPPDGMGCFVSTVNGAPLPINLPVGLSIVSKGTCTLRWYQNNSVKNWVAQKALHFMMFANSPGLTVDDFRARFNQIGWEECHLPAAAEPAEPAELVKLPDDLHGIEDDRIRLLYRTLDRWFLQTNDPMDKFEANGLHTWIAMKKPSFSQLLEDRFCARRIFLILLRHNEPNMSTGTRLSSIADEIAEAYGWEWQDLREDYLIR